MGFSISEYEDTDILAKLVAEGEMSSTELAQSFGADDVRGHHGMGIRLSWMKRFKMVALDDKTSMWMSTEGAERVLEAQKRAAVQRKIQAIPEEALVATVADAMARSRLGEPVIADMLRRQVQFGMSYPRRNGR